MKKILMAATIFLAASFGNVQAAQIDTANYLGDFDVSYPLIVLDDIQAAAKINSEIRAEVRRFVEAIDQQAAEDDLEVTALEVSYKIPCNHNGGILSVILTEFVNFKNAAHPSTFQRALNFNSDSGERIFVESLSEIAPEENGEPAYSPKNITAKLKAYAKRQKISLFPEFAELETVPQDFYFDDNLNVHFLFQQYEVAPYAVGIIDLNATEKLKP